MSTPTAPTTTPSATLPATPPATPPITLPPVPTTAPTPTLSEQAFNKAKLRRQHEVNKILEEELNRPRIPVSEAANDLINFTQGENGDYMLPSQCGKVAEHANPYARKQRGGCCIVM